MLTEEETLWREILTIVLDQENLVRRYFSLPDEQRAHTCDTFVAGLATLNRDVLTLLDTKREGN